MDTQGDIALQALKWLAEFLTDLYSDFENRVQLVEREDDHADQ